MPPTDTAIKGLRPKDKLYERFDSVGLYIDADWHESLAH